MVEHKDVVLALLGASAGLSGLLLVFLGFVVAAYTGLPGDVPGSVKTPLRRSGGVLVVAFAIGVLCVIAATAWLVRLTGGPTLYDLTVGLFGLQLVGLVVSTVWTLKELLWD